MSPPLARKEVRWGDVRILVRQATYGDALRRSTIIAAALRALDQENADNPGSGIVALVVADYASCMAATEAVDGLDLEALRSNIEAFLELPEELVVAWKAAVYELNPQWDPKAIFASLSPPSAPS